MLFIEVIVYKGQRSQRVLFFSKFKWELVTQRARIRLPPKFLTLEFQSSAEAAYVSEAWEIERERGYRAMP